MALVYIRNKAFDARGNYTPCTKESVKSNCYLGTDFFAEASGVQAPLNYCLTLPRCIARRGFRTQTTFAPCYVSKAQILSSILHAAGVK